MRLAGCLLAVIAACSNQAPAPAPAAIPIDAPPIDSGVTTIGTFDPAGGMHLDDDVAGSGRTGGSAARPGNGKPARPGRPIEVTLRSSPGGATAWVDGVELGPTPAFWQGEANGREHEFTFTLRGHFSARYRFVPVASGVVHARLERNGVDDGTTPPQVPAPTAPNPPSTTTTKSPTTLAPPAPPPPPVDAAPPVAPPPTLVSPADAAAPAQPPSD